MHPVYTLYTHTHCSVQGRVCVKACTVGDAQLHIPDGTVVTADVWSVHYDKGTWGDDADTFNPERCLLLFHFSGSESGYKNK